jgi:hypothetical protein
MVDSDPRLRVHERARFWAEGLDRLGAGFWVPVRVQPHSGPGPRDGPLLRTELARWPRLVLEDHCVETLATRGGLPLVPAHVESFSMHEAPSALVACMNGEKCIALTVPRCTKTKAPRRAVRRGPEVVVGYGRHDDFHGPDEWTGKAGGAGGRNPDLGSGGAVPVLAQGRPRPLTRWLWPKECALYALFWRVGVELRTALPLAAAPPPPPLQLCRDSSPSPGPSAWSDARFEAPMDTTEPGHTPFSGPKPKPTSASGPQPLFVGTGPADNVSADTSADSLSDGAAFRSGDKPKNRPLGRTKDKSADTSADTLADSPLDGAAHRSGDRPSSAATKPQRTVLDDLTWTRAFFAAAMAEVEGTFGSSDSEVRRRVFRMRTIAACSALLGSRRPCVLCLRYWQCALWMDTRDQMVQVEPSRLLQPYRHPWGGPEGYDTKYALAVRPKSAHGPPGPAGPGRPMKPMGPGRPMGPMGPGGPGEIAPLCAGSRPPGRAPLSSPPRHDGAAASGGSPVPMLVVPTPHAGAPRNTMGAAGGAAAAATAATRGQKRPRNRNGIRAETSDTMDVDVAACTRTMDVDTFPARLPTSPEPEDFVLAQTTHAPAPPRRDNMVEGRSKDLDLVEEAWCGFPEPIVRPSLSALRWVYRRPECAGVDLGRWWVLDQSALLAAHSAQARRR